LPSRHGSVKVKFHFPPCAGAHIKHLLAFRLALMSYYDQRDCRIYRKIEIKSAKVTESDEQYDLKTNPGFYYVFLTF
jgi:hypothetical protein